MFRLNDEATPEPPPDPPRKGLVELLRTMPAWQLLFTGVPPLIGSLVLHVVSAGWTVTCLTSSSTTSCVVTERAVVGLVPIGSQTIADVRGARVVAGNLHRTAERRSYYLTLDAADGEHAMRGTRSFEAADALARSINEATRTKAGRFEGSPGFVLFDAFPRVVVLLMTIVAAGLTGFGLYRLVT